jgi:hypothetical protein
MTFWWWFVTWDHQLAWVQYISHGSVDESFLNNNEWNDCDYLFEYLSNDVFEEWEKMKEWLHDCEKERIWWCIIGRDVLHDWSGECGGIVHMSKRSDRETHDLSRDWLYDLSTCQTHDLSGECGGIVHMSNAWFVAWLIAWFVHMSNAWLSTCQTHDCPHVKRMICRVSVQYSIAIGSSVRERFLNNYKWCNCDYLFEYLSNEML